MAWLPWSIKHTIPRIGNDRKGSIYVHIYIYIYPGWWFQTSFIFHNIWDNPSHWLFFKMVRTTNQIQYHGFNICERSIKVYHGLWDTLGSWGVNRKSYRAMSYTYLIIIISDLENAWTWTCKCWLSLAYPMIPPVTMVSPGTHPSLSWNSDGWWPQCNLFGGVSSNGDFHYFHHPTGNPTVNPISTRGFSWFFPFFPHEIPVNPG